MNLATFLCGVEEKVRREWRVFRREGQLVRRESRFFRRQREFVRLSERTSVTVCILQIFREGCRGSPILYG